MLTLYYIKILLMVIGCKTIKRTTNGYAWSQGQLYDS